MEKTTSISSRSSTPVSTWSVFGISMVVFVLFLYTGTNKLLEMSKFIFQMQLVPLPVMQDAAPILGWALPLAELAICTLLYLESTRIIGLYASLILMLIFESYIGWMKATGIELPCTCGGIISQMSWTTHFIFNAAIILLIIAALILHHKRLISKPV